MAAVRERRNLQHRSAITARASIAQLGPLGGPRLVPGLVPRLLAHLGIREFPAIVRCGCFADLRVAVDAQPAATFEPGGVNGASQSGVDA